jgi:hypothetical protein
MISSVASVLVPLVVGRKVDVELETQTSSVAVEVEDSCVPVGSSTSLRQEVR